MSMKRILAFCLALLLLLGISGVVYIRADRARVAEEKRVAEINEAYDTLLALVKEQDYAAGTAQAKHCLELIDPETDGKMYADVVLKLACMEAVGGERESALAHCRETLSILPDSAQAELLSSGLYAELGQEEEGEAALRRYIELSGDASYCYRLGLKALQEEDFSAAVADLDRYINDCLCQSDSEATDEAFYFRGVSHLALEHYAEAAADFERCIEWRVDYEESLFNAALCRLMNEEAVHAAALFNRCVSEGIQVEKSTEYIKLSMELLEKESAKGE